MAAFFCEPVIGAGGVHPPPAGYIEGVADLCAEHGVLLVIDSVICGFGRLGTWFGIERWEDVRPDLITFAKGVTSGYLPLGGVVVSGARRRAVLRGAGRPDAPPRRHLRRAPVVLRRGAARCSTSTSARASSRAAGAGGAARATRSRRWPTIRRSPRCARGSACSARSSLPRRYWSRTPAPWRSSLRARATPGVLVRPLLGSVAVSPPLTVEVEHLQQIADAIRVGLDGLSV